MATATNRDANQAAGGQWWGLPATEVAERLGVDPAVGLSSQEAADLLAQHGPNALPVEKSARDWQRFLQQYMSYMQMILLGAAIVSLAIQEWSTAALLILITVVNAVVGLRQEGKAESAMNALKAMVKATARVRRDGSEAELPAEELVVGDVVLLAAGDEAPADGRIVSARRDAHQSPVSAGCGTETAPRRAPSSRSRRRVRRCSRPATQSSCRSACASRLLRRCRSIPPRRHMQGRAAINVLPVPTARHPRDVAGSETRLAHHATTYCRSTSALKLWSASSRLLAFMRLTMSTSAILPNTPPGSA